LAALPTQVELPSAAFHTVVGARAKVPAVPLNRIGVDPTLGGLANGVKPARFIAVWEALNPSDVAVVPVAKLPSEMVSAHAKDADRTRKAERKGVSPLVVTIPQQIGDPNRNRFDRRLLPIQLVRCSY
jgi:hypothetical protein